MRVIYQHANPRKASKTKRATSKKITSRKVSKRRNPEEVTYGKGGRTQTVETFTPSERSELIKGRHTLTQTRNKIGSKSVKGSGRASNLINKKKNKLVGAASKKIAHLTAQLEKAKGAEAKKLALKLEGYTVRDVKRKPLRGDLKYSTSAKIAKKLEKLAGDISESGKRKLQSKIKAGKKKSKVLKATARKAERSAEMNLLRSKLAASKAKEKELTKLLSLGASSQDKADLHDIKLQIKELKSKLSTKGVGMAKKRKKVAKKATKVAKKVAHKTKKKATKRKAVKASHKRRGHKRAKSKKVATMVAMPTTKRRRRKSSKKVAVMTKKHTKKHTKKAKKSHKRKTKRNPYVVANPYIVSNPMFTKVDSVLDRVLGVSTVELGGIVVASVLGGKLVEWTKKIPFVGEQIAKIPTVYQGTAVKGVLGALLVGAEHFLAKKKHKAAPMLGDLGRGFLVNALVNGIQASPLAMGSTMAGPYIQAPRSMSGYVLDKGMGAVGIEEAGTDFKGGADWQGSTLGAGADWAGSTLGSGINDSVSDNFDFDSNPTFW